MNKIWLSVQEASILIGYHPERIRELLRDGKVEGRKVVTVWQVSQASLLAYVREMTERGDKTGRKKRGA